MTENQINTRDKYKDNLLSFIQDNYDIASNGRTYEMNDKWLTDFISEISNFFYNSGYNDAMESDLIEVSPNFNDKRSSQSFVDTNENEEDSIFAPKLDDISDSELIEELKYRGYKGSIKINKFIEL